MLASTEEGESMLHKRVRGSFKKESDTKTESRRTTVNLQMNKDEKIPTNGEGHSK